MKPVREVAEELARAHRDADPEIIAVFYVDDPSNSEVRLVEVSKAVGNTGSAMPFRFGPRPDLGVPYPSVIILLSPQEKVMLDDGRLTLPSTWGATPVLRPLAAA